MFKKKKEKNTEIEVVETDGIYSMLDELRLEIKEHKGVVKKDKILREIRSIISYME